MTLTNSLTKPSLQTPYLSGYSPFPIRSRFKTNGMHGAIAATWSNIGRWITLSSPGERWWFRTIDIKCHWTKLENGFVYILVCWREFPKMPKGAWNMLWFRWYLHQHLPYSQLYSATFKPKNYRNLLRIHRQQTIFFYLVVSTHLKNISQIESFPQIGVKIESVWNHHPVIF